jgi:predicted enzyme related to lactoylglutathione lyase
MVQRIVLAGTKEKEMRSMVALAGALALASASPIMAQQVGSGMYGIKIAVKDFQKTIAFYSVLGMKMGPKHNAAEWELKWDNPAQGSNIIMVHDEGNRMNMVAGGAFMMISTPDMKATVARLKAGGYPGIGEPRATPRASILMLKDPDGNQIELLGPAAP